MLVFFSTSKKELPESIEQAAKRAKFLVKLALPGKYILSAGKKQTSIVKVSKGAKPTAMIQTAAFTKDSDPIVSSKLPAGWHVFTKADGEIIHQYIGPRLTYNGVFEALSLETKPINKAKLAKIDPKYLKTFKKMLDGEKHSPVDSALAESAIKKVMGPNAMLTKANLNRLYTELKKSQ